MALDRQAVEKKDFPISRRGYEPEAVDEHLTRLADELEQAERRAEQAERAARASSSSPAPSGSATTSTRVTSSLAAAASEQVRVIVEAAETSANDIESSARAEAERIRRDAESDASSTRSDAISRSEEHVSRVGDGTSQMLQRVDAMEGELGALLDSLRTGTNRLNADLSLLQGQLGELHDAGAREAVPPPPPARPSRSSRPAPVAEPEIELEPEIEIEPGLEAVELPEEPEVILVEDETEIVGYDGPVAVEEASAEPDAGAPDADEEADVEGARLIALNMALNGQSRDETDAFLRDNFALSDRDGLLDEVYATVEG